MDIIMTPTLRIRKLCPSYEAVLPKSVLLTAHSTNPNAPSLHLASRQVGMMLTSLISLWGK